MGLFDAISVTGIILVVLFVFIASLYPVAFFITNVLGATWWSFDFYMLFIGVELILGGLMAKS